MFCECKYTSERVGTDVLDELIRRSDLVTDAADRSFCLFSKSGFTDKFVADRQDNVRLVGLKDMYA